MKLDDKIKKEVYVWLLNGVTYREARERLSWLGIVVTDEEINKIVAEMTK